MLEKITNIDFHCQNTKYIVLVLVSFILFILLCPGTIVTLDPTDKDSKCRVERKNKISVLLTHALVFTAIIFVLYYFYFSKQKPLHTKLYAEI